MTSNAVDEDPDHDRREPVEDVERDLNRHGQPARRELGEVDRDEHADAAAPSRSRARRAIAVPTIAFAMPPPAAPKSACGSREEVPAQRAGARVAHTETTTIASTATASRRRGCRELPSRGSRARRRGGRSAEEIGADAHQCLPQRVETADDHLGDEVAIKPITSRIARQVEQRRRLEVRACALVARGNLARERVAGAKE